MIDAFLQWWDLLESTYSLSLWCSIHRNRPGWCFELHHDLPVSSAVAVFLPWPRNDHAGITG